jgi:hypothetical protein
MSNCSSQGDPLNKWGAGCEHLAPATGDTKVTTIKVGSSPAVSAINTTLTSKGLGVPPTDGSDPKLNSWSPDPNSTLRPINKSDFENPPGLLTNLPKTGSNAFNPSQSLDPPQTTSKQSSPSQKPYIWKPYP